MSQVVGWPEDWPVYKQSCFGSFDDRCDMLVGPCACGASHEPGEFQLIRGDLFRNGKEIDKRDLGPPGTPGVGWVY